MKRIEINKNNFQFITDFQVKKVTDIKALADEAEQNIQLDFANLTIVQRLFLSGWLTYLTVNENVKSDGFKQDLYQILFNFDNERQRNYKFAQHFFQDITEFFNSPANQLMLRFVAKYKDTMVNGKTMIKRTQINKSEYALVHSTMSKHNYKSILSALYIIGVSKTTLQTLKLNKVLINDFCPSHTTKAKQRLRKLFEKMDYIEGSNFNFNQEYCFFSSGFSMKLEQKYFSEVKKGYEKKANTLQTFNSLSPFKSDVAVKTKQNNLEPIIEQSNNNMDDETDILKKIMNLPETQNPLTVQMMQQYKTHGIYISSYSCARGTSENKVLTKILDIYNRTLQDIAKKYKNVKGFDLEKFLSGHTFINDHDGVSGHLIKQDIINAIRELQRRILKILTEVYFVSDYGKSVYKNILINVSRLHGIWEIL